MGPTGTPTIEVPGTPAESGFVHGRVIARQLEPAFLDPFVRGFCAIKSLEPDAMSSQALAWFEGLPEHFRVEIDAMASGAGVAFDQVALYLYADIAVSGVPVGGSGNRRDGVRAEIDGPMCSAMVLEGPRIARNCDWYRQLLTRGTAAVVHRVPGRLGVLALGIFGDIDVDTGVNDAGLWVHAHTLYAKPTPRSERPRLSWLFWLRECLETCETIDEVDEMLTRVERDRGIVLVCGESTTGRRAIFEATIGEHARDDVDGPACATNHARAKHPTDPERLARSAPGSTTARYQRLLELARGDASLEAVLADEGVEMRRPEHLRTIYAATYDATGFARGRRPTIRFAAGTPGGTPASSSGAWQDIAWPF